MNSRIRRKGVTALLMLCLLSGGCGFFIDTIPRGQILNQTPRDHFIKVKGVNYHYTEYPGDGGTVVLLHGFGACTYTWEKISPLLNKAGYHVLALDMKGFGWSDKPPVSKYDPYTLMQGVNEWMEAMELKNVVCVGNSLGGAVAWLLALEHPDKVERLVLVDAAGYPIKKPFMVQMAGSPFASSMAKLFFCKSMVKWTLEEVYFHDDWITQEQISTYFDRLRTQNALDAQIAVASSLEIKPLETYISRIPSIQQETLIIWGQNDTWIPLETVGYRFRRELPNSRLVVLPDCGHIPQEEYPEKTAQLLLDFIQGRPLVETPLPTPVSSE